MATPKEVFESPAYRKLIEEPQDIPWAWFKDVYVALGDALQMLDKQQSELALLQTNLEAHMATLVNVFLLTQNQIKDKLC